MGIVATVQAVRARHVDMPPTQVRLLGFIAISIAVHVLMAIGAGRFDFSARQFGDVPRGGELYATLVPGDPAKAEAVSTNIHPSETDTAKKSTSEPVPTQAPSRAATAAPSADEPALGLPAAEKWYAANELDVRAEPLTNVELRYPEKLRDTMVVGKVRLRLFIDERGVVRKTQIAASEPAELFDEAAKQAWEDVRFSPALKNGVPVKSQKLLELTYHPR